MAEQARLGILGLSPTEAVEHSRRYAAVLALGARVIDLGSGAGIPGLVLAWYRPDLRVTLLDVRRKRADQLERLVRRLGLRERATVMCRDVDRLGPEHAGAYDALVARRFGPPAAVVGPAERLVAADGVVVVSRAPDDRWDRVPGWTQLADAPAGLVVLRRSNGPRPSA